MTTQTITIGYAQKEGRDWARNNPGFTREQLEARRAKYAQAWGDAMAHQFWVGAREA